jgi:hypothetical protein
MQHYTPLNAGKGKTFSDAMFAMRIQNPESMKRQGSRQRNHSHSKTQHTSPMVRRLF